MSYIGNPPVVQTNRLIYEEVVTVQGKTVFTPPGGYTVGANFLDVELNGNDLGSADFTATDGSTVTLAVGAGLGDLVRIIAYGTSTLSNATPADGSVTTAKIANAAVTQAKLAANVAGNGPAFSAYKNGNQTGIASGTDTKVAVNAENFDTASAFDSTTNYRFQPTVAGYYQCNAVIDASGTGLYYLFASIFKNGSLSTRGSTVSSANSEIASSVSTVIYLNGSTDYIELYVYGLIVSGTITVAGGNSSQTTFSAAMVRAA